MFSIFSDIGIVLKIVGFLFLFQWVSQNIPNRLVALIFLVAGGYFLLFMEWSIFSLAVVFFLLVVLGGLANLVNDLVFQYQTVEGLEREGYAMPPMLMRRRE